MAPSSKFWDKIADRYSKKPVDDEESYQRKLRVTREYLRSDMDVFEFGCGTGSTAITHAPFVKHILAIDISSRMIEIAQGKAVADSIDNITFEQATIEELSTPDQIYDVILGLSILHLLENKEDALSKVHKMLKPGGFFVSSTVCIGDTMKWFKMVGPIGKFLGLMPLVKVFALAELKGSLARAGFKIDHEWQPRKGSVFIVAKKAA